MTKSEAAAGKREERMWIVDDFIDRVAEHDEKRIREDNEWRARWKHKPLATFDTYDVALDFMVDRAKQRVLEAEKELSTQRKRLKKCETRQKEFWGSTTEAK